MATWAHHKEASDFDRLQRAISEGGLWVHRPLIVHERNTTGKKCGCGCGSYEAIEVERRDLVDVLIDPVTGIRRVRQRTRPEHLETWDRLASEARKIFLPHRVSRSQLAALDCEAKILLCAGGVRGGKSEHLAQVIVTETLLNGGFQTEFWWLAPTLKMTSIGLGKLALGTTVGRGRKKRYVKPLIPRELVRYVPKSTKSDNLFIELIDGSRIVFKYASDDGASLKGSAPSFIGIDEACEVRHREVYQQAVERLMESGGQLVLSTTPKAGHYLKEDVVDRGVHVSDWVPGKEIAWCHFVAWDNPWVAKAEIQRTIETFKDDPQRIAREIEGKWVGRGSRLWHHFDESDHIITDPDYWVPQDLGLIDVTAAITQKFFQERVRRYLGMDFNLDPMSNVEVQLACHPKDPKRLPIVIVPEEVCFKVGSIYEQIERLTKRGFAGSSISCDASGAVYNSYLLQHGIRSRNSTQAKEMQRAGFPTKPCRVTASGPSNPAQIDKVAPLQKLTLQRITLEDGSTFPRFLIHSRAHRTLNSLRVQESDPTGAPKKTSNTVSDKISGPIDALCYALIPIEASLFPDETRGVQFD